jgi:hypothetical protein
MLMPFGMDCCTGLFFLERRHGVRDAPAELLGGDVIDAVHEVAGQLADAHGRFVHLPVFAFVVRGHE